MANLDTPVSGIEIKEGSKVVGAAIKAPDTYGERENFRVDRQPRGHLAFGVGWHGCVGQNLARKVGRGANCAGAEGAPDLPNGRTGLAAGERNACASQYADRAAPRLISCRYGVSLVRRGGGQRILLPSEQWPKSQFRDVRK